MLDSLKSNILLFTLAFYPLLAYLAKSTVGTTFGYLFNFLVFALMAEMLLMKFVRGEAIKFPGYLKVLGLFVIYKLLVITLVSDVMFERGAIKYLYTDTVVNTFTTLLVIENYKFAKKSLDLTVNILIGTLVIGVVIIIYQISDPFFFTDITVFFNEEFSSIAKLKNSLQSGERLYNLSNAATRFLVLGYRNSIYSWMGELSIGFDSMSVFSILIALRALPRPKMIVVWGASAIIAFLSSYRWVMLNFLVVASQDVLTKKNIIGNSLRYLALVVLAIFGIVLLAPVLGIDIQAFVEERLFAESAGTRIYAFEVFGKVFPDTPIFGSGEANTPKMMALIAGKTGQIHVGYLKLFYYYGLVGGTIWLIFIFSLLGNLRKVARQTNYWGGYYAILAFIVANMTLVCFSLKFYGLLLAILFTKNISNIEEEKEESKEAAVSETKLQLV